MQLLTVSLHDIRQSISDLIPSLLMEIESTESSVNLAAVSFKSKKSFKPFPKSSINKRCELCEAKGRPFDNHTIENCFLLDPSKRTLLQNKKRNLKVAEVIIDTDTNEIQKIISESDFPEDGDLDD